MLPGEKASVTAVADAARALDLRVLVVDNYDSYTYNLVQAIATLTCEPPTVVLNDECRWSEIAREGFDCIVVSPGPGTPERASDLGLSRDAIVHSEVPLLGVCLGHQAIAYLNGARIVEAARIVHGGCSAIEHGGDQLFASIPQGFQAVRYHSLLVEDLPRTLEAIAWTADGELMALRHRERPQWGVQFHPESISTEHGMTLLANFLRLVGEPVAARPARRSRPAPAERTRELLRPHVARLANFLRLVGEPVAARPARRSRPAAAERTRELLRPHVARLLLEVDAETVFRGLYGDREESFWLDSSRAEEGRARFSFLGAPAGPRARTVRYDVRDRLVTVSRGGRTHGHTETIFDYLERELDRYAAVDADLPFSFRGGFVGYLGYETKADLGAQATHRSRYPDAIFFFVDRFVAFDHLTGETYLVALDDDGPRAERWLSETRAEVEAIRRGPAPPGHPRSAGRFVADLPRERYLAAIAAAQDELRRGESYELCLTTQLRARATLDPLDLYSVLRRVDPAPYAAFQRFGSLAVLCSSPERFLRLDGDGWVETKPIKGTARRSDDPVEDAENAAHLRRSAKTAAENLMITDVLRNDLGRIAEIGTVEVPVFLGVESYATVHQLVSAIRARLRDDAGVVDCLRAVFPGGSMTGAPRLRTMAIIDRLEPCARGIYSGTLGYLSIGGAADLNVVIRTLVADGAELAVGVGGAITIDSDPDEEFDEAMLKAQALVRSVDTLAAPGDAQARAAVAAPR